MPTIICSYCEYIGRGDEYENRIADVELHEETCREKSKPNAMNDVDLDECVGCSLFGKCSGPGWVKRPCPNPERKTG